MCNLGLQSVFTVMQCSSSMWWTFNRLLMAFSPPPQLSPNRTTWSLKVQPTRSCLISSRRCWTTTWPSGSLQTRLFNILSLMLLGRATSEELLRFCFVLLSKRDCVQTTASVPHVQYCLALLFSLHYNVIYDL